MHTDEQQWSPVVFFDAPRCILCFRCVRVCDEGMGVRALGVQQSRRRAPMIVPNHDDHLECDECGMCIDICPVGALTSGTLPLQDAAVGDEARRHHLHALRRRLQDHAGRAPLRYRQEIIRGNNRDHTGINGEFLCIKGRYAFDFADHPERLQQPLMRKNGQARAVVLGGSARADRQALRGSSRPRWRRRRSA